MPAVFPHAISESLMKKHGVGCGSKAAHMGKVSAPMQIESKVNKLDSQHSDSFACVPVLVDLCHAEVMPGLHNILNGCGQ